MTTIPRSIDSLDPTRELTRAAAESGAVLVRVHGARSLPAVYRLTEQVPCVVGSAPECDLVVDDVGVSRAHVRLSARHTGILVEDLGSTNGTTYLGQRIERLEVAVGATLGMGQVRFTLEREVDEGGNGLLAEPDVAEAKRLGWVLESRAMQSLWSSVHRLRGSRAPVLITGASGTGKELVAQSIHRTGPDAQGPFVALNCGAFSKELLTSELFGHRKGAFTGALTARDGAFASAHGGTLFLDEIGELPLDVQPALLRALELGEIRRVGDDHVQQVRVRVVSATHRDLGALTAAGAFRQDMFYRLAVIRLHVPSLVDRPEDIEPLARAFAAQLMEGPLPEPLLDVWRKTEWPGNARELRNAVQTYHALGTYTGAPRSAPALSISIDRSYTEQRDELMARFTRTYLERLLEKAGNNLSLAARMSGLDRAYLGRLLKTAGLKSR